MAAVVVGNHGSRRAKAKKIGGMFRKGLGKVANAAGAAAAAANTRNGGGGGESTATTAIKGESGDAKSPSGTPGDRGSGGFGAAARAALAGIRVSLKGKESPETLAGLMLFQELQCHDRAIWTAKFNHSGRFLATAGEDATVLLHRVGDVEGDVGEGAGTAEDRSGSTADDGGTPAAATAPGAASADPGLGGADRQYEKDFGRMSLSSERPESPRTCSPGQTTGDASSAAGGSGGDAGNGAASARSPGAEKAGGSATSDDGEGESASGSGRSSGRRKAATVVIDTTPWQIFKGHTADVVDLSWSKNDFLLSASIDMTVRAFCRGWVIFVHCFVCVSLVGGAAGGRY